MADTESIDIREEDISYLEDKIVSRVFSDLTPLLTAKSAGLWRSAGTSDNIQQCLDKDIMSFVWTHLHAKVNIIYSYI